MSHTIALVDDDRNILTSISMALENEGFKVQTYIDAENALVGISRNPPDLAVIDIKMPGMDGEELLKRLRKKTSMPVIFLTSKDIGPCPPSPLKPCAKSSCIGCTTRSTPSYIPENKLSNADLLLSEKIFEAMITATPRIMEDVVKKILTG